MMNCEKCFKEYCERYNLDEVEINRLEKELAQNGQSICGTGKSFPCPQGCDKIGWGGKRQGAGKKKTLPANAKRRNISLTDAEYEYIKKVIDELRK